MFSYQQAGIKLNAAELWLDAQRKVDFSFVSHGHADHLKKHKKIIATPVTARFHQLRQGAADFTLLEFGQTLQLNDLTIELYPAGHILGSAMIRVQREGCSLLYTGDFKMQPGMTCEPIVAPQADILIMESTYGHPDYVFNRSRDSMAGELFDFVNGCFRQAGAAVVLAYSLGKSQEAMKLLGDQGFNVQVHHSAWELAEIYAEFGVRFSNCRLWDERPLAAGDVLVLAPHLVRTRLSRLLGRHRTVLLSGWGNGFNPMRNSADHVIPFSDHADFAELFQFIDQVQPQRIYTTHGPEEYPLLLQERGYPAERLALESPGPSL
jgi:putative mRNA 3-end processing factor